MNYTAEGRNNRHFVLMDEQGKELGRLDYTAWMQIKANVELPGGKILEINNSDFWHTTMHVIDAGTVIANISFNWKGDMILAMSGSQTYKLKHRGFLNPTYVLMNEEEHELMVLHPNFQFMKLSYSYTIETRDEAMDAKMILLAIYCVNHRMHMMAGGAA